MLFETFKKCLNKVKSMYILRNYQLKLILLEQEKASLVANNLINKYLKGELEVFDILAKKKINTNKIIWQYWGQGIDERNLPRIIRICFNSVDKHKGEFTVIRLSDENICDYLDLPKFVISKLENKTFSRAFFSDLLRICLLKAYGGVWLDATIFLTDSFPDFSLKNDHFVFQRSGNVPFDEQKYFERFNFKYWSWEKNFKVKMLSSIFFSKKEDKIVSILEIILLNYWKNENNLVYYFFLQVLYLDVIGKFGYQSKCMKISDTIPHYIHLKMCSNIKFLSWNEIFEKSTIHKLSYFNDIQTDLLIDKIQKYYRNVDNFNNKNHN